MKIESLHIETIAPLIAPQHIKQELPISPQQQQFVWHCREKIAYTLSRKDKRLLLVVGPCSVHDITGIREYASKLKALADEVSETFIPVLRVYFEKPRSAHGWKGILHDPHLNGTPQIETGIRMTRQILLEMAALGIPTAAEILDPLGCYYFDDLLAWGCIGARTSASQIHRQLASGLPMPIGFKNSIEGCVETAVNAIKSARHSHAYIGLNQSGAAAIIHSRGNPNTHLVLRGGSTGPNFDALSIQKAVAKLAHQNLPTGLMIDCSHDNSQKQHEKQVNVFEYVIDLYRSGHEEIIGLQLESHLLAGRQPYAIGQKPQAGLSITDACLDWDATHKLIYDSHLLLNRALCANG